MSTNLKRTSLYEQHKIAGGRLIDFGGWELPVQYTGIIEEHLNCRTNCGLFDVSHMGEFFFEGSDAEAFLNFSVTNDISKTFPGRAMYTVLCRSDGGMVDDLVIYRLSAQKFLLIVNASNIEKDFAHFENLLREHRNQFPAVTLKNESAKYSLIALQGRHAEKILQSLTATPLNPVKFYHFTEGDLKCERSVIKNAILSRTGYTGEDGFEILVPWNDGPDLWASLLSAGKDFGLKPCGLGARDTLRTEMKYPLYGQELTDQTHPLEAGLSWVVKLEKPDFVGKTALLKAKAEGLKRKSVGLKAVDRSIFRPHFKVSDASLTPLGEVTSGTHSPSLKQAIAIAYVPSHLAAVGTSLKVEVRGQWVDATVVETPFYKRPY